MTGTVHQLNPKTLPKNNFDRFLDGCIKLLPIVTTAATIKFIYRGNRV